MARRERMAVHALLREGDVFGDFMGPPGTTLEELAVASSDVDIWSLADRDLPALLATRSPLVVDLIRGLNDRLQTLHRDVNALLFRSRPAHLAKVLLALGETHGEPCAHGGEVDLSGITQQDLADLVGASRSYVSIVVGEMKRAGILSSVGRTLCVRNRRELRQRADARR
jgi:CRP-like cAMP-binding protein